MGKAAGDPPDLAGGGGSEDSREEAPGEEGRAPRRWWRCAATVLLDAAVVLSALFWLPPFAARRRREDQARGDPWAGADVVASFRLQRMISELCGNKSHLEYDIFEEIGINNYVVLYVTLTNLYGSTVAPLMLFKRLFSLLLGQIINHHPCKDKQLAQTLRNSSSGNLGLNHTVFGRVKQISLSYLQHSLNNSGNAQPPSPAPQSNNQSPSAYQNHNSDHGHHHHRHHIHHRHHHHHDHSHQSLQHLFPAPAPLHSTTFPSCDSTCKRNKHSTAKHHSSTFRGPRLIVPAASPNEASGPYVHPPSFHPMIPSSPLPDVVFHAMPPSTRTSKPPNKFSSVSPASISFASRLLSSHWWVVIASFVYWPML